MCRFRLFLVALGDVDEEANLYEALEVINNTIKRTTEEDTDFKRSNMAPWISDKLDLSNDER